jgi:hypothetical protein
MFLFVESRSAQSVFEDFLELTWDEVFCIGRSMMSESKKLRVLIVNV